MDVNLKFEVEVKNRVFSLDVFKGWSRFGHHLVTVVFFEQFKTA